MVVNYFLHDFSATIADFEAVSAEDLAEVVVFRKMLIKIDLKMFADCGYVFTERGIKPNYIFLSLRLLRIFLLPYWGKKNRA